jgi:DNA-binding protein YbaB
MAHCACSTAWGLDVRADDVFDLSGLGQLQREAAQLAEQLSAGVTATQQSFVGGDDAGAVEVTVDDAGSVTRVRLDAGWKRVVGVRGLGPAVVSAVLQATTARLTSWAEGVDAAAPGQGSWNGGTSSYADAGMPDPFAAGRGEPGDPSSDASMANVRELLWLVDDMDRQLAQVTATMELNAQRPVVIGNATRTVRVTLVGGSVTAVDFDQEWLSASFYERVATAIHEALRAGEVHTQDAARQALDGAPAVVELQRLASDPATLLRHLGFLS